MRINSTVKKRVFSIDAISEEESIVLRTLLNLNEKGVRERLDADKPYWKDDLGSDDAARIGLDICKSIMDEVDNRE